MNFEKIQGGIDPLSAMAAGDDEDAPAPNPEYEVVFKQKPLGFTIWKDTRGNNAEVIRLDNDDARENGVKLGSRVLKLGGTAVEFVPHEQILNIIRNGKMPMRISFRHYPDREQFFVERNRRKLERAKLEEEERKARERAKKATDKDVVDDLKSFYGTGGGKSSLLDGIGAPKGLDAALDATPAAQADPAATRAAPEPEPAPLAAQVWQEPEPVAAPEPEPEPEEEFEGFGVAGGAASPDDDESDLDEELARLAGGKSKTKTAAELLGNKGDTSSHNYDGLNTVLMGDKNKLKAETVDNDLLDDLEGLDTGLDDLLSSTAKPKTATLDLESPAMDIDDLFSDDAKPTKAASGPTDMDDMLAYINANS